jgi:hypothetical protein
MPVEQIQVSSKSDNNNGLYMNINVKLWSYLAEFFSDWEMFQTIVVEKIKICILCSAALVENRVVYEIMWENTVEPDRPQMKTEQGACALRAGYLRLQAHTQSLSNAYCFSTVRTNASNSFVICQVPVLLLSPKVIPPFCRTSCIYNDVIRVTPQCTWIIYRQLRNPSPFHFLSLLYFWPQPKGLWHFHTTRYVI